MWLHEENSYGTQKLHDLYSQSLDTDDYIIGLSLLTVQLSIDTILELSMMSALDFVYLDLHHTVNMNHTVRISEM